VSDQEREKAREKRLPSVFYNAITLVGGGLAALSFGLIIFLMVLEAMATEHRPYMGIVAFVILPVFLLIGLAIALVGAVRQHRRRQKGLPSTQQLPRIDLNDGRHLRATVGICIGGVILLVMSAFGSFKAYEYTDSDQFCGETCHEVMQPEFTAYGISPHARVGCIKCHIGPGAEWFVRSKLSGAYQVYAVLADKVPKPIETPIKNLRPSRDTCEQCHWPAHFYSENLVVHDYFGFEEENTNWRLHLLMKIGGGHEEHGPARGIHWHMNIANEVTYVATDEERIEIPWVKTVGPDGTEKIYRSVEADFEDEDLAMAEIRTMDCIDCHNRPTHHYNPPGKLVNRALAIGKIDSRLPSIKSALMEVMSEEYETTEDAMEGIEDGIREFYAEDYPEIAGSMSIEINQAIEESQRMFRHNIFPEMKVSWREFPDHIGHLYTPGCFRCHDGLHETEDGEVLTRDCNVCHTIVAQEIKTGEQFVSLESVEYKHPEDIDEAWKEMHCSECHGE
jgi:hypothetical protein